MRIILRTKRGREVGELTLVDFLIIALLVAWLADVFLHTLPSVKNYLSSQVFNQKKQDTVITDTLSESSRVNKSSLKDRLPSEPSENYPLIFFRSGSEEDSITVLKEDQTNISLPKSEENTSPHNVGNLLRALTETLTAIAILFAIYRFFRIVVGLMATIFRPFTHRSAGLLIKKLRAELKTVQTVSLSGFNGGNKAGQQSEEFILNFKNRVYRTINQNSSTDSKPRESALTENYVTPNDVKSDVREIPDDHGQIFDQPIWKADWGFWNTCDPELRRIREYAISSKKFNKDRRATQQRLKALSKDTKNKIQLLVATVQPSIILAAQRVISSSNCKNSIEIVNITTNGPDTVAEAVARRNCNGDSDDEPYICFAAPLATMTAYQAGGLVSDDRSQTDHVEVNPYNNFVPVTALIEEKQEILFLQDYSRTPLYRRRPKLYYYDNSTSEECVAKLAIKFQKRYEVVAERDYALFKDHLSDSYIPGRSMEPGDAIALWDPLITYYKDRAIGNGVLSRFKESDKVSNFSQIFLYADTRIADTALQDRELIVHFLRALIMELRVLKRETNLSLSNLLGPVYVSTISSFAPRNEFGKRFRDVF